MENFGRYINTATDETATLIHDGVTKTLRSDSGKEMTLAPAIFKKWWKPVDGESQETAEEPKQEEPEPDNETVVLEPVEKVKLKNGMRVLSTSSRGGCMSKRRARHIARQKNS